MNGYFGEPWDAPCCEDSPRVATPVGQPCLRCEVPIKEGDQGWLIPYAPATGYPHLAPWHRACFLASILGPRLSASLPPDVSGGG